MLYLIIFIELYESILPKTILISVSEGFSGYGDFLFALKMAAEIKKKYLIWLGEDAPEIKIFTQPIGKHTIQSIKGDTEFGIEVLTPTQLDSAVKDGLEVASVIEGPVFSSALVGEIEATLKENNHDPVPLIMIPEYAYSHPSHREQVEYHREDRKKLDRLKYHGTIYTGFNPKAQEKGIILSDGLENPDKSSPFHKQLDEKIQKALKCDNLHDYQEKTDLYFQYSRDLYPTTPNTSAAIRFLNIHRIYAKDSDKNQDVLMVGTIVAKKLEALKAVKSQLISDGYKKIIFYNADTGKEEYLYGDPSGGGKHYRVVYTAEMSHSSMIAAQALSGDLVGATGDQSFGEAVSGNKVLVYECLDHKQLLCNAYYEQLKKLDPECVTVLDLLKNAHKESQYNILNSLLTLEMKEKLKKLCGKFRGQGNLVEITAAAAMPIELLAQVIRQGKVSPYLSEIDLFSPFARILREGQYDAVPVIVECHTANVDDRKQFCETLMSKNHEGKSFISLLSEAKPEEASTSKARYLVTQFNLAKYKAKTGSKRAEMVTAFHELISAFNNLGIEKHDEKALIGLMLLTTKNIANEYSFLSPRKGIFFGSEFYSTLKDSLKELGVNLRTMTLQDRQHYYKALADFMENNPLLVANEYILKSLSKEANIILPKVPPLLDDHRAKELLGSRHSDKDPTIFRTESGIYKTHFVPLEHGGWGSVYAARHYSFSADGDLVVSPPLAIKVMPERNQLVMDEEMSMFKKVYPEGHFERFNNSGKAYLAIPLFPGLQLDDYLDENLDLSKESRLRMVTSLLENLQALHKAGITHNALTPKNILYDPASKKMHIVDFSCAKPIGELKQHNNFASAVFPFDIHPEYKIGSQANPKMDLFSLTPVVAEILGINKKKLVEARVNMALSKIKNTSLANAIKSAFEQSESLETALLSEAVKPYVNTKDYESFVTHYAQEKYDFSPYKELLDEETLELLNNMQSSNPDEIPDIEQAIAIFKPKRDLRPKT